MPLSPRSLLIRVLSISAVFCVAALALLLPCFFLISSGSYLHNLAASTNTIQKSDFHLDFADSSRSVAEMVSKDVTAYVKGSQSEIRHSSYFRAEELSHLAEVRSRVSASFAALYVLAAVVAVSLFGLYVSCRKFSVFAAAVKTVLLRGGVAAVALATLLFLASLSFDSSFAAFHTIVFPSGNWEFPSGYLVVNLFTEEFFARFAKDAVIGSLIFGAALAVFAETAGSSP